MGRDRTLPSRSIFRLQRIDQELGDAVSDLRRLEDFPDDVVAVQPVVARDQRRTISLTSI
jgi:hypothetical protein